MFTPCLLLAAHHSPLTTHYSLRFRTNYVHPELRSVISGTQGQPQGLHLHFHIYHIFTFLYSVLNDFTGLAIAAFIAWKATVTSAIRMAAAPATKKIHHAISTL